MTLIVEPPTRVPFLDGLPNYMAREWRNFLLSLQGVGQASPQILQEVALTTQNTSVATTPITLPTIGAGFYRISVYQTVTVPAGVSSSLDTTITWTDHGVILTKMLATMNGNTTATYDGQNFPIHVDDNSPISYAIVYASNPVGAMKYNFGIVVEQLA